MTVQSLMLVIPVIALAIGGLVYAGARADERQVAKAALDQPKKSAVIAIRDELVQVVERVNNLLKHPSL
jgi:hypothetical protein